MNAVQKRLGVIDQIFDWFYVHWLAATRRAAVAEMASTRKPTRRPVPQVALHQDAPGITPAKLATWTDTYVALSAQGDRLHEAVRQVRSTGQLPDHTQRHPAVRRQEI